MKIEVDFELGNLYYSSQLLWNALLLRGFTKSDERELHAATLDFRGEPFTDMALVGVLPEPGLIDGSPDEPPHIAGCRTEQAMVVRVKGYRNDFMSFQIGGKWTPPITPEITGGILSCHGTEAVVTRVEPAGEGSAWKTSFTQCHCNSAGCRGERVFLEKFLKDRYEFAPREGHVDAVDLRSGRDRPAARRARSGPAEKTRRASRPQGSRRARRRPTSGTPIGFWSVPSPARGRIDRSPVDFERRFGRGGDRRGARSGVCYETRGSAQRRRGGERAGAGGAGPTCAPGR